MPFLQYPTLDDEAFGAEADDGDVSGGGECVGVDGYDVAIVEVRLHAVALDTDGEDTVTVDNAGDGFVGGIPEVADLGEGGVVHGCGGESDDGDSAGDGDGLDRGGLRHRGER